MVPNHTTETGNGNLFKTSNQEDLIQKMDIPCY